MTKRIALFSTLILSIVLLSSCPGGSTVLVGKWAYTYDGGSTEYGIEFFADGTAEPFMIQFADVGTFTWEVEGTRVVIHQDASTTGFSTTYIWAAELSEMDTVMSGARIGWKGVGKGSGKEFLAAKVVK